jgi:hypothetical protein
MPPLWLVPATFLAHVAEEAPGFTSWARRNASSRYRQRDFVRDNTLGAVLTLAGTAVAARHSDRRVFGAFYTGLVAPQMLGNSIFHAGATVAYREYSPGLLTALALFLPLWAAVTRGALSDGLMTRRGTITANLAATALHAATVADQVYFARPNLKGLTL